MYYKTLYVALVVFLVLNAADGKKSKKNKRIKNEEESSPQPNVVSYSTFGFNDVGSYDGFVPTSPDYANYLSGFNQESTTRLYAPAFPTAMDTTGFGGNYGPHPEDEPSFATGDDSGPQSSMLQFPQNSMNFFNTPSFEHNEGPTKNMAPQETFGSGPDENNAPVYGTKLGSRGKNKYLNPFNNTEFNIDVYSSGPANLSDDKYFNFNEVQSSQDNKPVIQFGESSNNYPNFNSFLSSAFSSGGGGADDFVKPASTNVQGSYKFPKVVDFTKIKQWPMDLDKFPTTTPKPIKLFDSVSNGQKEHGFTNNYDDYNNNKYMNPTPTFKNTFDTKTEDTEKRPPKTKLHQEYPNNYVASLPTKTILKDTKFNSDYKEKLRNTHWGSNHGNDFKNWKNPLKGYEYSTNVSSTSFKYDADPPKKTFNSNTDEVVPASSNNLVDLTNYQPPESDYSNFKKIPDIKTQFDDDFSDSNSYKSHDKFKTDDYINQFKNLYSTVPTTTTNWGNIFKTTEYSSYKNHIRKPQYNDDYNEDVVTIPKRPQSNKHNYGKYFDSKPSEWSSHSNQRPQKLNKFKDWTKDVSNTRFKSEEDLLGLRNHDTSHPSYLPTFKPTNDLVSEDSDYKNIVEKWRQSYLKSKYKDSLREYEGLASDTKPQHVPIPKPYPIEVPHPVIVPVPQPYPVRVPVPKPVAVPVVREITVPIEKPVPYPVIKKVPYPIEKPVPVHVEKEVQVPVMKPYPVPVPHIRPVFHHSRPPRDEYYSEPTAVEDDDYLPRPDSSKKYSSYKRPRSPRNRPRRPTRMSYQDRNRRRWPSRRPNSSRDQRYPKRPTHESQYSPPYKNHDFGPEEYESGYSELALLHCKRTGNC